VIAPRPLAHILDAKPNAPNETRQHRNELRSEIRPEKYQPQHSAHRGNEFAFDRSSTQKLSVMLKSRRVENQCQNSRRDHRNYKPAGDCELFVCHDPKKDGQPKKTSRCGFATAASAAADRLRLLFIA
jgi:hypothetical protein